MSGAIGIQKTKYPGTIYEKPRIEWSYFHRDKFSIFVMIERQRTAVFSTLFSGYITRPSRHLLLQLYHSNLIA